MYEFKKTEDQELLLESLKEVYERNDLDAYFKECDEKHEFPQKAIDVIPICPSVLRTAMSWSI